MSKNELGIERTLSFESRLRAVRNLIYISNEYVFSRRRFMLVVQLKKWFNKKILLVKEDWIGM